MGAVASQKYPVKSTIFVILHSFAIPDYGGIAYGATRRMG